MLRRLGRFLAATLAAGSVFLCSVTHANDSMSVAELPREALATLARIRDGGPFPYDRDGVVFNNFERRLPPQPRGYYREYTVRTPGERTRGARRIITGGQPPVVFYYTADHYQSFRQIRE